MFQNCSKNTFFSFFGGSVVLTQLLLSSFGLMRLHRRLLHPLMQVLTFFHRFTHSQLQFDTFFFLIQMENSVHILSNSKAKKPCIKHLTSIKRSNMCLFLSFEGYNILVSGNLVFVVKIGADMLIT